MKIVVDMAATVGKKSGFGQYVERVVEGMKSLPGDQEIETINFIKRDLRTPERIIWDQIGVPIAAAIKRAEVLFVPAFSAPLTGKPLVMTVHDIYGALYPELFSGLAKYYWSKLLPASIKRADKIICISQYTQRTVVEKLDLPVEKTCVISLAAADVFQPTAEKKAAERLARLGLDHPFVVSVGTIEPRKNFERLIDAFVKARKASVFAKAQGVKLVLVGKKSWGYEGVMKRLEAHKDVVTWLDYLEIEDLVALYSQSLFTVAPSLFEGFGLPVLEAMQCGSPVAVADATSLPEVAGEAGLYFSPKDTDSMAKVLVEMLGDESLRAEMRKKSLVRAKSFSWEKNSAATLAVIRETATIKS